MEFEGRWRWRRDGEIGYGGRGENCRPTVYFMNEEDKERPGETERGRWEERPKHRKLAIIFGKGRKYTMILLVPYNCNNFYEMGYM